MLDLTLHQWIDKLKYHNENYGMSTLEILESLVDDFDELESEQYSDSELDELATYHHKEGIEDCKSDIESGFDKVLETVIDSDKKSYTKNQIIKILSEIDKTIQGVS